MRAATAITGAAMLVLLAPALAQDSAENLDLQTLRYEARPSTDGSITLVPLDEETEAATGAVNAGDGATYPTGQHGNDGSSEFTEEESRQIASSTAERLMKHAMDSVCGLDILPRTVTPSISVSFNLFAGGELAVEAEWETAELCIR